MNEFFQRLKQRKLVQWAIAYVASAFALLQGLDIIANRFDLPSNTVRLVILAMIVGFFVPQKIRRLTTFSLKGNISSASYKQALRRIQ